ncbi:MAG: hypothetical protein EHM35_11905 [Planctomycetaceae bacterium]|nr:MAG: hypothetical protein EHM35_11905 [Planctomycetaceae bacterium]
MIENLLYPELQAYGRKDRVRLLQEASKEPLDFLEWVGILTALVLVVSFTRYPAFWSQVVVAPFGLQTNRYYRDLQAP